MELSTASVGFGVLAGLLSTLSPCMLPLLPLVLAPASATHRLGVPALAAGVVISFVAVGLFVATIGFAIGVDGEWFRLASATMLALLGIVLLSSSLQTRVALAAGGVSNAGQRWIDRLQPDGVRGQFLLGLLLGAVWSPCVGPTLGAASVLAAQGKSLLAVAAVMLAFGLGAAFPLLIVGQLSREAMKRWRGAMLQAGKLGKLLLGGAALLVAGLILTGVDHQIEAFVLDRSPDWLARLTTRY
ncbi:MAG: cytochrome c biogenesis protein CcdA [Acetobacteraceae bacterium]|nr:cytochrome c biogenesis protein CcdA [Acetobacteraceae bacterium]